MKQKIIYIALTITIATTLVLVLFFTSEHLMKKENPFTRRFLPHPLIDFKNSELAYNSYYITGFKNKKIYLGNTSAPLHGLVINTDGIIQDTINLKMETFRDYPFSSIKWNLLNDTILLNDYTIGMFLKSDLKIKSVKVVGKYDSIPFSIVIPYDTNKYILRTYNENQNNVNLSLLDIQKNNFKRFDGILDEENQSKDLFSNDGKLLFNKELQKFIYVFYYKNKVFHFDLNLENSEKLQTIDTITRPDFTLSYLQKKRQIKMSNNATVVNKYAATSGNYLYISSNRIGKNERKEMYKEATIIDIYDLRNNQYVNSFYFYNYKGKPIHEFFVEEDYIIGLGESFLSIAKFRNKKIVAQQSGISRKPVIE